MILEILEAVWSVLTYSNSGNDATLAFLPVVAGLIGGAAKMFGGEGRRAKNRMQHNTSLRWAPYGVKPVEKEKGSILSDMAEGMQHGMNVGSGLASMGGQTPTVPGGEEKSAAEKLYDFDLESTLRKGVGGLDKDAGPRGIASLAQAPAPQPQSVPSSAEGVGQYNVGQAMGGIAPQMQLARSKWEPVGGRAPGNNLLDPVAVDPRMSRFARGY